MRVYSVYVEVRRASGDPIVDPETVYELLDALPSCAMSIDRSDPIDRYTATFSLEAASVYAAIADAEKAWGRAHKKLGIPMWKARVVEARDEEILIEEINTPNFPDLVGVGEIADMIGATKQRAHSLARSTRFPRPVAELAAGPIFMRAAVESFLDKWERKPGRPRKAV